MSLKISLQRNSNSNKGDFGHVLIIGGDHGMGGAVIMAAEAAYRVGAGKVTVLTREENFVPLLARLPNAMTASSSANVAEIFAGKTVIVIGCGLGKSGWGRNLLKMALAQNLPKIIDADALNILSESGENFDLTNSVITPHVGEASRLLALTTKEIQADRESAAQKLQKKYSAIIVLKGEGTLILGEKLHQCSAGNAGMATAGMGDVLSGIIGGLVAQHLNLENAASFGVNIHAIAGDLVKKEQGEIGMMPTDLFQHIPQIINGLKCN